MAKLTRSDTHEEHALRHGFTQIGRLSSNDIQVFEREVSRSHCHIEGPEGGWVVVDHGTRLGTYVNGHRVRLRGLYAGDKIRIGSVVFEFDGGGQAAGPPPAQHLHPLSDIPPDRLVPPDAWEADGPGGQPGDARAAEAGQPEGAKGGAQAAFRSLAALPSRLAGGALASLRHRAPRKLVQRTICLVRQRDADGVWGVLSDECRQQTSLDVVRARLQSLPEPALQALGGVGIGQGHRGEQGGVVLAVSLQVEGKSLMDEVVVCREGGDWKIHSVPVGIIDELSPEADE